MSNDAGKDRLDTVLVARGLVHSRSRARALILAGKVEVAGEVVTKAGFSVASDSEVRLREADHPYVSRGGLKLTRGLDAFGVDPGGVVAIDVGASTGGFTDVLLRRGAARVYAIDVGYGQLAWSLRNDPRVVVLERENIRHLDPARIAEPCHLAVIDVSFISLTRVVGKVAELMGPPGGKPIIALVKPQFEAGKDHVGKGGVVRDEAIRAGVLVRLRDFFASAGFAVGQHVESPIRGPAGNIEYLLELRTPGG
ncbi:MAG: TlyA family RNA methyltransferase [Proteobacteria bacterium]|nr:TlyA family RNA methyltransferase [Pseudomonadota bacterium]